MKMHSWMNHHHKEDAFQLQATYRKADLTGLNSALAVNGIPALTNNNIWLNLSNSHVFDNGFLSEDGIGFTPTSSATGNNYEAQLNQYQLFLRFGYNFSKDKSYRIYPFAGINLSDAMLRIRDNNAINGVGDFSQEIGTQSAEKTFNQGNVGFELGGGFDYVIRLGSKQVDCFQIDRFIPIGVRAGYYIRASSNDWKIDEHSLANSPIVGKNAFFVTLNIGLGLGVRK